MEPNLKPWKKTLEPNLKPWRKTLEPNLKPWRKTLEPNLKPWRKTLEPNLKPWRKTLEKTLKNLGKPWKTLENPGFSVSIQAQVHSGANSVFDVGFGVILYKCQVSQCLGSLSDNSKVVDTSKPFVSASQRQAKRKVRLHVSPKFRV